MDKMDWVDAQEQKNQEERGKEYFNIEEGENKFQLLTHCAPLAQVWNNAEKKYEIAEDGDKNVTIKGVCFVLQDGLIKLAKLPYTVVKDVRALQNNEDWEFALPFEHILTLTAKNAKTKEVEYSLVASPKKTPISEEILQLLTKKGLPEDVIEKMKAKSKPDSHTNTYPENDLSKNVPF